jgi:hypothetical protein
MHCLPVICSMIPVICYLFTYAIVHVYLWYIPCLAEICSVFYLWHVPCLPILCSMFNCFFQCLTVVCSMFTFDKFHINLSYVSCFPVICSMFTCHMFHVFLWYVPCLPIICSVFTCDMFHVYLWYVPAHPVRHLCPGLPCPSPPFDCREQIIFLKHQEYGYFVQLSYSFFPDCWQLSSD